MAKFKTGLYQEYDEKKCFQEEQERLREKHDLSFQDDNVVVVEKANTTKFILRYLVYLFKTIVALTIAGLCFLGVVSLIYPEIRFVLFNTLDELKASIFF